MPEARPSLIPYGDDEYYVKKKQAPSIQTERPDDSPATPSRPDTPPQMVTINGRRYWVWIEPVDPE